MVRVMDSHAAALGSIPGICKGTLSKKVNSLFISKEILKAEISKIGPPYDMNFVGTEQTKLCWYRADKALSALYQQS